MNKSIIGKLHKVIVLALFYILSFVPLSNLAQSQGLQLSEGLMFGGDLALTFKEFDKHNKINTNFYGDDAFNPTRVRTYLSKEWTVPDMTMIIEFLWDYNASTPRVQGAYVVFNDLFYTFSLKAGFIGSAFGNFAYRSNYFNQNPVIGSPLMWGYKTPLRGNGARTNVELDSLKDRVNSGVPAGYDVCWDTGFEIYGNIGMLETVFALTRGSISNPSSSGNDGYQKVLKIGLQPKTGLRFGVSAAFAPWIRPDVSVVLPNPIHSYLQKAYGMYFERRYGHWEIFAEGMQQNWDAPFVHEGKLSLTSGYVDAKWRFKPSWYLGGRVETLRYDEISTTNDGTGVKKPWGLDLNRIEFAISKRLAREVMLRVNYQSNIFVDRSYSSIDILALQLQMVF